MSPLLTVVRPKRVDGVRTVALNSWVPNSWQFGPADLDGPSDRRGGGFRRSLRRAGDESVRALYRRVREVPRSHATPAPRRYEQGFISTLQVGAFGAVRARASARSISRSTLTPFTYGTWLPGTFRTLPFLIRYWPDQKRMR